MTVSFYAIILRVCTHSITLWLLFSNVTPVTKAKSWSCSPQPGQAYRIGHRLSHFVLGVPAGSQKDGEEIKLIANLEKGTHVQVQFELVSGYQNLYNIIFKQSKKEFKVIDGSKGQNAGIVQSGHVDAGNQRFAIDDAGGGWCTILSSHSDRYLAVEPDDQGQYRAGSRIIQGEETPDIHAHFRLVPIGPPPSIPRCLKQPTDLIFLLDGSSSVTKRIFKRVVLRFVRSITRLFDISSNTTRVGVIQYTHKIRTEIDLDEHQDRQSLERAIAKIKYMKGWSHTGHAISYMTHYGFSEHNGARPMGSGVHRVAIVITDGQAQDGVNGPAIDARYRGISLFVVGVHHIRVSGLEVIGGEKVKYIYVRSFKALNSKLRTKVENEICPKLPLPPRACQKDSKCSHALNEICKHGKCGCPPGFCRFSTSGQCGPSAIVTTKATCVDT